MSKKKFAMRVIKGGFEPADQYVRAELRERKYNLGDIVFCTFTKPRNPGFHRLVHAFGALLSKNLEAFKYMDAHTVLKRLQVEGNIACDEMAVIFPGIGPTTYRMPQSLSYESMDQGKFNEVYSKFCQYVIDKYWPGMTEEQIQQMAEMMEEE
jgi:hypothetical protein